MVNGETPFAVAYALLTQICCGGELVRCWNGSGRRSSLAQNTQGILDAYKECLRTVHDPR